MFDTKMVFMKEFFEKNDSEKKSADNKKFMEFRRGQRDKKYRSK